MGNINFNVNCKYFKREGYECTHHAVDRSWLFGCKRCILTPIGNSDPRITRCALQEQYPRPEPPPAPPRKAI